MYNYKYLRVKFALSAPKTAAKEGFFEDVGVRGEATDRGAARGDVTERGEAIVLRRGRGLRGDFAGLSTSTKNDRLLRGVDDGLSSCCVLDS